MKVVEAHTVKHDIMRYAFFERGHQAVVTEGLRGADVLGIKGGMAYEFEIKVSRSDLNKELAAIKYATMVMKEGKKLAQADEGTEQHQLNLELGEIKKKAGGWSKISKHEEYIDPKKYFEDHKRFMLNHTYIPNYFYIVVPQKLVDHAIENTKGTGYGIIAYDGCRQLNQHYAYQHNDIWYERGQQPEGAVWRRGAPCDLSTYTCLQEIAVRQKAKKIHPEKINDGILLSILQRAVTENIRMLHEITTMSKLLADNNIKYNPEGYYTSEVA